MKKNHKIRKEKRKFIGYRINKTATLRMLPDIFWTPFEKLDMILSISVDNIQLWREDEKVEFVDRVRKHLTPEQNLKGKFDGNYETVGIKFNLMDYKYNCIYFDSDSGE